MLLQYLKRGFVLTREVVSDTKLRGGFYSPEVLVQICLNRVEILTRGREELRLLEPTVGDGAFIRGLSKHALRHRVDQVTAVEVSPEESAKASTALAELNIAGEVHTANVLEWNNRTKSRFDVAVGNPPYVRFQFLSAEDRQRAMSVGLQLGVPGSAVSNLWISVLLLTLDRLEIGGVFSLIVPMEFMTGVSASRVRAWLIENTTDLSIDLFRPGSFPAVLQEVVVLSGRRSGRAGAAESVVDFFDHNGGTQTWSHSVTAAASTWTSYLLTGSQLAAWEFASQLEVVRPLGSVARFTVSTVTGANDFFCVGTRTAKDFELLRWTLPLLPRIKHAPGLVYEEAEHRDLSASDASAWMLSFAADTESPLEQDLPQQYLAEGEGAGIHQRFKCRVRDPWFRVPVVAPGSLLMSKRSSVYPRVIVNRAGVVTTDTVYRGVMQPGSGLTAEDVAASFHNSLTLLSVEVRGRSFGGGVLELVPSEIASILLPIDSGARNRLAELDEISRVAPQGEALIERTDDYLMQALPQLDRTTVDTIRTARMDLAARRARRSAGSFYAEG